MDTDVDKDMDMGRPFVSYTRTEDGMSLVTEVKILKGLMKGYEGLGVDVQLEGEEGSGWMSDTDMEEEEGGDDDLGLEAQGQEQGQKGGGYPLAGIHTPPPEKQVETLSLPATPKDFDKRGGSEYEDNDAGGVRSIPISWSGRVLRSASGRKLPDINMEKRSQSTEVGVSAQAATEGGKGRKRCLQLDLRGVGEGDMAARNVYHMGE
jgi:hypothetical protein